MEEDTALGVELAAVSVSSRTQTVVGGRRGQTARSRQIESDEVINRIIHKSRWRLYLRLSSR